MSLDTRKLRALERALFIDEVSATLRHDFRNRSAAVKNAVFYIQRRLEKSAPGAIAEDPRLVQFLDLIRSELDRMESLVAAAVVPAEAAPACAPVEVVDALVPLLGLSAAVEVVDGRRSSARAAIGELELAVALQALFEALAEVPGPKISLSITSAKDEVRIDLLRAGWTASSPEESWPMRLARRALRSSSGKLELQPGGASILLPSEARAR